MNPGRQSPGGAVFEERRQAVGGLRRGRGQAELARLSRGSSYFERRLSIVGDDTRNRRLAVEHRERLASPHFPQMLAEVRFEIRDANFLHDLIMVINGHVVKSGFLGVRSN